MHAFKLNQPVPELQPVGSVSLLDTVPAINKRYSGAVIYCCNNSEEVDHV